MVGGLPGPAVTPMCQASSGHPHPHMDRSTPGKTAWGRWEVKVPGLQAVSPSLASGTWSTGPAMSLMGCDTAPLPPEQCTHHHLRGLLP